MNSQKPKRGRPKGSKSNYTLSEAARQQRQAAGRSSYKKRGRQAYQVLGRKGSETLWNRYRRIPHPARPGGYLLQHRQTGHIIGLKQDHNEPPPNIEQTF